MIGELPGALDPARVRPQIDPRVHGPSARGSATDLFLTPSSRRRYISLSACGRTPSTGRRPVTLLGPGKPLRLAFESRRPHSMIL